MILELFDDYYKNISDKYGFDLVSYYRISQNQIPVIPLQIIPSSRSELRKQYNMTFQYRKPNIQSTNNQHSILRNFTLYYFLNSVFQHVPSTTSISFIHPNPPCSNSFLSLNILFFQQLSDYFHQATSISLAVHYNTRKRLYSKKKKKEDEVDPELHTHIPTTLKTYILQIAA